MQIGSQAATAFKIGAQDVNSIYVGSTLVFSAADTTPPVINSSSYNDTTKRIALNLTDASPPITVVWGSIANPNTATKSDLLNGTGDVLENGSFTTTTGSTSTEIDVTDETADEIHYYLIDDEGNETAIQIITGVTITTLLLDIYTGAQGAWALRDLSSSTTNVVRVRRSSDDTQQDFTAADIAGSALTNFTGAGDGFVVTAYDQSGNGIDISQSTLGLQPQIVASGAVILENGQPAMDFAGGKFLTNSAATLSLANNAISIFTVETPVADATQRRRVNYAGVFNYRINTLPLFVAFDTGSTAYISQSETSVSYSGQSLFRSIFDGVSGRLDVYAKGDSTVLDAVIEPVGGGTAWGATESIINPAQAELIIGASTGGANPWDGLFQEFIIYTSDQSSNRIGIEQMITEHYGIQAQIQNSVSLIDRFIQGVEVSGTTAWVTSTPDTATGVALRKYDTSDWSVISTANKDDLLNGLTIPSLGDCTLDGGTLYIAAGESYILEIDPDTLAYVTHQDLTATTTNYLNMIAKKGTTWYVGETNADSNPRRILKFDESWSYLGIAWESTAPDGEDIVQGGAFVGDYLFTGLHTPVLTVFELDGSGNLSIVDTIDIQADDVQGLSYDGGDLYVANRTPNNATGSRVTRLVDFTYP